MKCDLVERMRVHRIDALTIVRNFDEKCTDSEFYLLKLLKLVYFYQLYRQLQVEMEIEPYALHSL